MYYVFHETEGSRLEGRPILIAATASNVPEAYSPAGQNLFPLAELLSPLRAAAHRCRLRWAEPFLVYRAGKSSDAELADTARLYAETLRDWQAAAPSATAA
ncbi:hypothetical protein MesoLjLc_06900 [Mesorhizobium sp. L-8-10]|uniref:NAD(P)H-dependent oxidoreductase n=1 Tax=Mesorhizobium sp. L-8-10 TaxID=2744523 RepID=UPI001934D619|nr:NAD(P)H-dependent oxidoreductase [Mesorhizobium sp. L-8-10]BCH28760.1 hypothetical protein MesoLjLc_06900 [Mesorhizobium sp. L-8-10]